MAGKKAAEVAAKEGASPAPARVEEKAAADNAITASQIRLRFVTFSFFAQARTQFRSQGRPSTFLPSGPSCACSLGSFSAESSASFFGQVRDSSLVARSPRCFLNVPLCSGMLFSGAHFSDDGACVCAQPSSRRRSETLQSAVLQPSWRVSTRLFSTLTGDFRA